DDPEAGTVTLVLGDKPLELQQWTIVDDKGQEVRVGLYDPEFGVQLENSLFRTPEKKKNPKAH
ncbi:MAG TPA: outer membrane lipoprotein carrier protein LolA, partial [Candidatus Binatia bacterium]|nr:outer membrane lipoprotein carrier protein LolA [Candidatus Binatia bacterium]